MTKKKVEKPKTFKDKIDAELDLFTARMRKIGVHPLCVAALWLEPNKIEGKPIGASLAIPAAGDSGLEVDFLHQNAVYGLRKLADMVVTQRPEFFQRYKTPEPPKGKSVH